MAHISSIVVDAGYFIKRIQLQNFNGKIYTTAAVLSEIRDKATREYVSTMLQQFTVKDPSETHRALAAGFARATGDIAALSAVDLELVALVSQLSVEAGAKVREAPSSTTT